MLKAEGAGGSLAVVYVTAERIRRFNLKYRGRDSSTDVLAFSAGEGMRIRGTGGFLGDIMISLDAAERQAEVFGSTSGRELRLYLIHGILHLLGYEDKTERARARMRLKEEELLEKVS